MKTFEVTGTLFVNEDGTREDVLLFWHEETDQSGGFHTMSIPFSRLVGVNHKVRYSARRKVMTRQKEFVVNTDDLENIGADEFREYLEELAELGGVKLKYITDEDTDALELDI